MKKISKLKEKNTFFDIVRVSCGMGI